MSCTTKRSRRSRLRRSVAAGTVILIVGAGSQAALASSSETHHANTSRLEHRMHAQAAATHRRRHPKPTPSPTMSSSPAPTAAPPTTAPPTTAPPTTAPPTKAPPTTAPPTTAPPTKAPPTTAPPTTAPPTTAAPSSPPTSAAAGAGTTGVPSGTVLTNSGSITVTQANTVISNLHITGSVTVEAAGVTIKNSRIDAGNGSYGINVTSGDVTVSDTTITGSVDQAIGFDNWKAYRVDISGVMGDAVKLGNHTLLEGSYIHNFNPGSGAHSDGAQLQSGVVDVTLDHNTIDGGSASNSSGYNNSAIFLAPDLGPNGAGPVKVTNNILGGGGFSLWVVDGNNGQYLEKAVTVTGNRFVGDGGYGNVRVTDDEQPYLTWSDNSVQNSGATVSPTFG